MTDEQEATEQFRSQETSGGASPEKRRWESPSVKQAADGAAAGDDKGAEPTDEAEAEGHPS